jgi:DNA repair protein RadD
VTYTLRQYQAESVAAGAEFLLSERKRNGLIVLPTGSGKSLVIAGIAERLDGAVLVFQPSKEILEQNLEKFQAYGFSPAVYSASMGRKGIGDITLATIGSVKNKAHLFQDFPTSSWTKPTS